MHATHTHTHKRAPAAAHRHILAAHDEQAAPGGAVDVHAAALLGGGGAPSLLLLLLPAPPGPLCSPPFYRPATTGRDTPQGAGGRRLPTLASSSGAARRSGVGAGCERAECRRASQAFIVFAKCWGGVGHDTGAAMMAIASSSPRRIRPIQRVTRALHRLRRHPYTALCQRRLAKRRASQAMAPPAAWPARPDGTPACPAAPSAIGIPTWPRPRRAPRQPASGDCLLRAHVHVHASRQACAMANHAGPPPAGRPARQRGLPTPPARKVEAHGKARLCGRGAVIRSACGARRMCACCTSRRGFGPVTALTRTPPPASCCCCPRGAAVPVPACAGQARPPLRWAAPSHSVGIVTSNLGTTPREAFACPDVPAAGGTKRHPILCAYYHARRAAKQPAAPRQPPMVPAAAQARTMRRVWQPRGMWQSAGPHPALGLAPGGGDAPPLCVTQGSLPA